MTPLLSTHHATQHYASGGPNWLQQQFTATAPDRIWLADITYVPTEEGWLYLAVVMDLFSRRPILDWTMAVAARSCLPNQLLHHSNRGSQYTSADYQALLAQKYMLVSMSGTGNCYDNAPAESFFSLLKTELVHPTRYPSRSCARRSIFEYIEVFYNRQRLHSALAYLTPLAAEQCWSQTTALTAAAQPLPLS